MMIGRRWWMMLAVTCLATAAAAQGGMGGRGGGGGGRGGRGGRGGPPPEMERPEGIKAKDFQSLNPAKLLREKRKNLKLDDAQLKELEGIEARYEWNSRQLIHVADSVSQTLMPAGGRGRGARGAEPPGPPSDEEKAAMEAKRAKFREALGSVREEFELARTQSLARMREAQVAGATKILDDAQTELLQRLVKAAASLPPGPPG